jgi:hypothetical protein
LGRLLLVGHAGKTTALPPSITSDDNTARRSTIEYLV